MTLGKPCLENCLQFQAPIFKGDNGNRCRAEVLGWLRKLLTRGWNTPASFAYHSRLGCAACGCAQRKGRIGKIKAEVDMSLTGQIWI